VREAIRQDRADDAMVLLHANSLAQRLRPQGSIDCGAPEYLPTGRLHDHGDDRRRFMPGPGMP